MNKTLLPGACSALDREYRAIWVPAQAQLYLDYQNKINKGCRTSQIEKPLTTLCDSFRLLRLAKKNKNKLKTSKSQKGVKSSNT